MEWELMMSGLFSGFFGAFLLFLIREHLFKPVLDIEYKDDSYFHPITKVKHRLSNNGEVQIKEKLSANQWNGAYSELV